MGMDMEDDDIHIAEPMNAQEWSQVEQALVRRVQEITLFAVGGEHTFVMDVNTWLTQNKGVHSHWDEVFESYQAWRHTRRALMNSVDM